MNWDAIGAVGEILGATAVVVSLIYLSSQIRTQNRESRVAAMHDVWESFRKAVSAATDIETADVLARANEDFDSLTNGEALVVIAVNQAVLRVFEEAFYQHGEGRLDVYLWDVMVRQYSAFLSAPYFSRVWDLRKDYFHPDFREFVDSLPRTDWKIR